eukprot:TRINITY_DN62568_c0_g1_i1.p1 TRINITY_DN62568_c0_g1~~TRINITY_DN62568_c0_g1_i1.p1  ORF type:complete len:383 (+),score=116.38 TRINITY_DN62568_c0_g1_i1:159-1307(+)
MCIRDRLESIFSETESIASPDMSVGMRPERVTADGMRAVDDAWAQYDVAVEEAERRAESEVRRLRALLAKTAGELEQTRRELASDKKRNLSVCLLVRRLATMVVSAEYFHHWARTTSASVLATCNSALIERQSKKSAVQGWPCLTHAKWVVHKKVLLELQESQETIAMLEDSNADLFAQVLETNSLRSHLEETQEEARHCRHELHTLRTEHAKLLAKCADPCGNELLGVQRPGLDWSDESNGFVRKKMADLHSELLQGSSPDLELPRWSGLCDQLLPSLYMQALSLCAQLDAKCTLMTHAKRHAQLQATLEGPTIKKDRHGGESGTLQEGAVRTIDQMVCLSEDALGSPMLWDLSLIHISEPTRLLSISYAVFCLKKKKHKH